MEFHKKAKFIKVLSIIYLIASIISTIYSLIQLFGQTENVFLAVITLILSTILSIGNFIVYNTVGYLAEYVEPIELQLQKISKNTSKLFNASTKKVEVVKTETVFNPTSIDTGERWICECGESNHPKAMKCIHCGKDRT